MADKIAASYIPYYRAIMEILETTPELKNMAKGISKQVAIGATGTIVGGIVLGPLGALIGACAGAAMGYATSDDYSSLVTIIRNLTDAQKRELVLKVQKLVTSDSVAMLKTFVLVPLNQQLLLHVIQEFGEAIESKKY